MPFIIPIDQARRDHRDFAFVTALTPSEQKAAFHVRDKDGADLCLKIISPNYCLDRLQREIRALQLITHPNVVGFKEYVFSSKNGVQQHYMIEEFVHGEDLAGKLQPGMKWERKEASGFFNALCDGLAALKQADIVHRDLKPNNIRVRLDGSPVIIDFGLARHLTLPALTKTTDGAAIGTPIYFAPEQFDGTKHDIDHRTDLFAVGVLLFEALCGRHPFWDGKSTFDALRRVVCESSDYAAFPEFLALPDKWRLLLEKLLSKERSGRPNGADQVAKILRALEGI